MNKKQPSKVNARNMVFAQMVAGGSTKAEAYRKLYRANIPNQRACEAGARIAARPAVAAEINRLRAKSEHKEILSINDRLRMLALRAQDDKTKPGELARLIDVYNKTAGDQAPERHEVSGPAGAPIVVAAAVSFDVTRIPVRQRMEMGRAARAAAKGL